MEQNLLNDFKRFLNDYRESWNSLDTERMSAHQSKDLIVRWASPDAEVSDWGHDAAKEGWYQAYKQYEGRNPKWYFEDLYVDINSEQEGVAVFSVTFELDGALVNSKLLFTETFRQEQGEWKKIREYVENGFSLEQKIHS